ncbi:MAG: GAF domain-containing SpoIIE family protein phosphatase [Acidobacteriota bacterium]
MDDAPDGTAVNHEKFVADLQAVLEVSLELAATDSLIHLVQSVERAARKMLECEHAMLLLYDPRQDALRRPSGANESESTPQAQWAIARQVVQSGRRVELEDPLADPSFDGGCDGDGVCNLAVFPLHDYEGQIVGVLQAQNLPPMDPWDRELIRVFDAQVGVAVQRQLLLDHYAEKQRIQRDLKLARNIQQGLLPDHNPTAPGFDIAGWNEPADDTGGDFWDHYTLPDGSLALVLADATGHGIGAALMMATCRSLFRATTSVTQDLGEVIARVNELLYGDLADNRSVTAVLGFLQQDTLSFLSAGHGPVLRYLAAEDRFHSQPAHGIPLGIMTEYPWPDAEPFAMASGDLMILVTDGFFEWANANDEEFGIERLQDVIRQHLDRPAKEIIRAMHDAVTRFVGDVPQSDDLTALLVRKL